MKNLQNLWMCIPTLAKSIPSNHRKRFARATTFARCHCSEAEQEPLWAGDVYFGLHRRECARSAGRAAPVSKHYVRQSRKVDCLPAGTADTGISWKVVYVSNRFPVRP